MNIYLLKRLSTWILALCLSVVLLVGINYSENKIKITNTNKIKNISVYTKSIGYETIKKYNNKLETGKQRVLVEGKNGLAYNNSTLVEPVSKVLEIGTKEKIKTTYMGNTTGYGADCEGCMGVVACKTEALAKHDLIHNGVYYDDSEYGKVRIISADTRKFGCGTIIEIDNGTTKPFMAIVLDTGGAMKSDGDRGIIHIDVAFKTEKDPEIYKITTLNNKAKFNVKRWGW